MSQQSSPTANHPPVRVIAITGCDGSGKSTLATSLVNHLSPQLPAELIYLGQSSGRIGEWISSLPLIGAPFGRYLLKKKQTMFMSAPPPRRVPLPRWLSICFLAGAPGNFAKC